MTDIEKIAQDAIRALHEFHRTTNNWRCIIARRAFGTSSTPQPAGTATGGYPARTGRAEGEEDE